MRTMLIGLTILLLASPASAISQRGIDFCFTTSDPKACLSVLLAEEQANQRAVTEQRLAAPGYVQPLYPNFLLLGAAPAFINGVNQGFHQMQLPYVDTPQFQYHP